MQVWACVYNNLHILCVPYEICWYITNLKLYYYILYLCMNFDEIFLLALPYPVHRLQPKTRKKKETKNYYFFFFIKI